MESGRSTLKVKGGNRMRIYDVGEYEKGYIVRADGVPCKVSFEKEKQAWKHAEGLAKLYARIKGLTATYDDQRPAWVVE